jgi:hypothetical protein
MKAKLINGVIDIIDYDAECSKINEEYNRNITINSVPDSVIDVILKKNEDDRTIEDLKKLVIRKNIEDRKIKALAKFDDYKDFVVEEYRGTLGEYERLIPSFEDTGDAIKQTYKAEFCKKFVNEKIYELKKKLVDTDYQVIKYYEAKITLSEMPYTSDEINSIIAERQGIRDKINELQEMIKK